MKIADGVISKDGDCVILGAEKVYFNVNFNWSTFKVYDKCVNILNVQSNPLFKYDSAHWPIIGVLHGCDYLKRIPNIGHAAIFNKILPKLVS